MSNNLVRLNIFNQHTILPGLPRSETAVNIYACVMHTYCTCKHREIILQHKPGISCNMCSQFLTILIQSRRMWTDKGWPSFKRWILPKSVLSTLFMNPHICPEEILSWDPACSIVPLVFAWNLLWISWIYSGVTTTFPLHPHITRHNASHGNVWQEGTVFATLSCRARVGGIFSCLKRTKDHWKGTSYFWKCQLLPRSDWSDFL